jgi:hypothetical protein
VAPGRKPDFSGEYALNREASVLSPNASAFNSAVLRIRHEEPVFHCEASFIADGQTFEFAFERVSEGDEHSDEGDDTSESTLRWDGSALVLDFTDRSNGPESEATMSWRYELLDGRQTLCAVEQIRGGGRDQDNVWVFEKL